MKGLKGFSRALVVSTLLVPVLASNLCAQLPPDLPYIEPECPPILVLPVEPPEEPPVYVEPPIPQFYAIPETGIPEVFPPAEPALGDAICFQADDLRVEDVDDETLVNARGNVTAVYKNITVTSNAGNYDSRTEIATFQDNVTVRIDGQVIRGQTLSINLTTREYALEGATTTLPPSFFVSGVLEPVYLGASRLGGVGRQRFFAYDSSFTTCNLEEPHYVITGSEVSVFPQRKIVVKKASLYVLGKRILTIPRFVVPIRRIRNRSNLIPQVGQSAEEGFFLKTAYNYLGTARQSGLFKLDLMSKKGVGQGIEQTYNFAKAAGSLYLYNLFDRTIDSRTFTGRLDHRQDFGGGIQAHLTSDIRNNSYLYAPESTSWDTNLFLQRNRRTANTDLAIRRSVDTGFGRIENITSSLQHRQVFDECTNGLFAFDYATFQQPQTTETGTQTVTQGQLVSRGQISRNYRWFDLGVNATKITDISDEAFIGSGFAGIERLPEVDISSDTNRLGIKLPYNIPLRAGFTAGRYTELPIGTESNRFFLQLDSSAQCYKLSNRLNLTAGAGYRQFVYASDAAQYVLDTSEELVYSFGENSSAGLGYRYMKPHGFSPFRFDQISEYNMLNGRLNIQETERFKLGLVTGYNFNLAQTPWQDIAVRALFAPSDQLAIFGSTAYDPNRGQWRSLINQFRFRLPRKLRLDIGTRYDIETGKFGSLKTAFDWQVTPKWRLQGFTGYNGFTKQFDYMNFRIERDLHCWVASLTYVDRGGLFNDKGIMLNLNIKAFPVFNRFGLGQFGQPLDTSVGQLF